MKKAIYIGNDTLREVNDVASNTDLTKPVTDLRTTFDVKLNEYPVTTPHSFEVGREYEYGKDYKLEQWCNNKPTLNGVNTFVQDVCQDFDVHKNGCKNCYIVAIPIPQETERKFTLEEMNKDKVILLFGVINICQDERLTASEKVDELFKQFHITKR